MASIEQLRADAREHAKQIEAVQYLGVKDLAARWGVSPGTVRKISRASLPYIEFGDSGWRRYDPRDVELYEAHAKSGEAA